MDWDWLTDFLNDAWEFLSTLLLWVPQKLYDLFLSGVAAVIVAIPVPAWAQNLSLSWIPSGMAYWLEPFQVSFGLTCITSAYLMRFVLRRIPGIG